MGSTSVTPPDGSVAGNIVSDYGIQTMATSALDGLANSGSLSSLVYANLGSATNCKVILNLAPVVMASSGTVRIDDGTNFYEMTVPSGTSGKRVEWNTIPASFLASFSLINNLGVAFAATGNSLIIVPIY
jgi:hypothetical protein